jgi:hypothetical protein
MHMRRLVLSLLCVFGCGSGAPGGGGSGGSGGSGAMTGSLLGVYKVTGRARHQPCDGAGTPEAEPYPFAYFAVTEETLVNGRFVDAIPCTGAARTSCDEQASILFLGKQQPDGSFAAGTYSRQESGGMCEHTWSGARVKQTATGVVLQEEYRSQERAAATCAGLPSEAEIEAGAMLPCVSVKTTTGVRM